MLKKWREKRRIAREVREFNEGYNWAAGWLVKGKGMGILNSADNSPSTAFGKGTLKALADFSTWCQHPGKGRAFIKRMGEL